MTREMLEEQLVAEFLDGIDDLIAECPQCGSWFRRRPHNRVYCGWACRGRASALRRRTGDGDGGPDGGPAPPTADGTAEGDGSGPAVRPPARAQGAQQQRPDGEVGSAIIYAPDGRIDLRPVIEAAWAEEQAAMAARLAAGLPAFGNGDGGREDAQHPPSGPAPPTATATATAGRAEARPLRTTTTNDQGEEGRA